MDKNNSKYRRTYMLYLGGIILFWAVASWAVWCGLFRGPGAFPMLKGFLLPILLLSWPAHEIALEISGKGSGANAWAPASWWSFLLFSAQAVLLWLPMMPPCKRSLKVWPWVFLQAALFMALFLSFWKYGNG